MNVVAIIPARMGSSRFPGKPLAKISGMPMLGHVYFRTCLSQLVTDTYVATCDDVILEYVESVGGKTIMTSSSHERASDRTAEAMIEIEKISGKTVDIVVMVQGDEPLVDPHAIDNMIDNFKDDAVDIANLMSRLTTMTEFCDHNNVKVVFNDRRDALYFSREPIPSPWKGIDDLHMYMQVGVIGFRREALVRFNSISQTSLERAESVDMNRVLENGGGIRMVFSPSRTIGVDVQADLDVAEGLMKSDKYFKEYCST